MYRPSFTLLLSKQSWASTGAIACWVVCLGEGLIHWHLQSRYEGYNPYRLSISYLGRSDSPVRTEIMIWGVCYTLLFLIFAIGIYQSFKPSGQLLQWVVFFWFIYALGEGMGSAFFPFDHVDGKLTFSGKVHNMVSGISDAAFLFLPLMMSRLFMTDQWPSAKIFAKYIVGIGFILMTLFLLSKWQRANSGVLAYAGLWQRLFLLDYYIFMMVFSVRMMRLFSIKETSE